MQATVNDGRKALLWGRNKLTANIPGIDDLPTMGKMAAGLIPVDPNRQRELRPEWLRTLAKNWSWKKCEPLIVFRRRHKNNELALWKGQHRRTTILSKFGEDTPIDVSFVDVYSDQEEDQLWESHLDQKEEASWTHADKTLSKLNRGNPTWINIRDIVFKNQFSIQWKPIPSAKKDWCAITSTKTLEEIYEKNPDGPNRLAETLKVIGQCWKGIPESTSPAVLRAVDAFVCRFKPKMSDNEWTNVLKRLQKIDPAQIQYRSKNERAGNKLERRCFDSLLALHDDACSSFFNGRGKLDR